MKNRLSAILMAFFASVSLNALSFSEIRALGKAGEEVALSGVLEGLVVSDYRWTNTETGENIDACIVNLGASLQTAYIQNEDGSLGFRVKFRSIYGNRLERGQKVSLALDGCRLLKETDPERYTILGLVPESVTVLSDGNPLPRKERHVGELKDEDVYTAVTLLGLEFRKKEGGYINVNERHVQITSLNEGLSHPDVPGYRSALENADAWPALLRDDRGDWIYMLVNSTCLWRRNNMGVPQGVGAVTGVIVHDRLYRYGNDLGTYCLRPMDISDFEIPRQSATSYETVCAWNWDFNRHAELDFEKKGKVRFPRPGEVVGERIVAETGSGFIWTDSGASLSLDDEFNARHSFDGWKPARMTGSRSNSALRLDCTCGDWYRWNGSGRIEGYNGIYLQTSLKDIETNSLTFNFSIVASREHSRWAEQFPVDWKVSYSTDGENFVDCQEEILLRPIAFNNVVHGKRPAVIHNGCAVGFLEFCIPLPLSLLGKEVTLRLSPRSNRTATVPETFDGPCCEGKAEDVRDADNIIRIGDISITCLKKN